MIEIKKHSAFPSENLRKIQKLKTHKKTKYVALVHKHKYLTHKITLNNWISII